MSELPIGPPPGWYVDPHADDMLRWWDGEEWSESDFKLRPPASSQIRHELRLGPFGRLGSLVNAVFSGILMLGMLFAALTVDSHIWIGVAITAFLFVVFVAVAVVVRVLGHVLTNPDGVGDTAGWPQ
ncbi:DUF2510 domain-containing protein [Agromyces soli]|uniref:DUF2510 domain-containing protein n=1 Tax=Agromyces soli TaxID=659012 RepID=A0ABY4AT49_9MICO|nr:DUF2510 domain-containing protein [Agromyces soli]UOE26338.1 DUF2510 domain-containing protein [Agromyces soli]